MESQRCAWAKTVNSIAYHDQEWGVPVHSDRVLFAFLLLEGAQAGLSWETILGKRAHYQTVFDGFDPRAIAAYDQEKVNTLLADPGIVRNRLKVNAAIQNARSFLAVQEELGSFDAYIWRFIGEKPQQNTWRSLPEVPTRTPTSDAMSKALQQRGFKFVGSTICYAFMQAVGMVNDHLVSCFRHAEVRRLGA